MNYSCTETSTENTECNLETQPNTQETVDPDYLPAFGEKNAQLSLKIHEKDAKENAVKTIKHIVRKQFALEMRLKEQEIEAIDNNIRQTKLALDRIRACVLARYYGMSEIYRAPHSSWSKLRRSRRESKQLRSLAKTSNSSSPNNISRSSSSNFVKQNHQLSSAGKKVEEKFDNISNKSTLKEQNSITLSSSATGKSSLNDHTYSANLQAGQLEATKCDNKLFSCHQSPVESIRNSNSTSSSTCMKSVNQTQRNTTVSNASQSSASLESHLSASTDLQVTKVKVTAPEVSNAQDSNFMGILTLSEPTSAQSSSKVNTLNNVQSNVCGSGSRFYVKKRIIIGNTSKYIPPDRREDNDKSTHKWMVYVRGPPHDPNIDSYIKKVWFFLHPSYRPNDIVEINKPPFHLTRRGWGEFPIRVQLHFIGSWNKRVDVIHELKLDKTYTGLQTLGAETVIDLEIDIKTFEECGIPVPMETQASQDQSFVDVARGGCSIDSSQLEKTKLVTDFSSGINAMDKNKENSSQIQIKKINLEPSLSTTSEPSIIGQDSRSNNPIISSKVSQIDDNLEQQLHILAEKIPLIHPKKDPIFSFRAPSVRQYFEWPIGKQRASEWQRALKIRNQLRTTCNSSTMTTKEVMIWCRCNGYTPQRDLVVSANSCYCKICGRLQGEEGSETVKLGFCPGKGCLESASFSSTLSSALDLLTQIEEQDKRLESNQNADDEDVEVDVVNIPASKHAMPSPSNKQESLLTIPLTQEQQWVRDVCNEVGVCLRPETLEGVEVNTVESMLFSAAKQFMKQVMHAAVAVSNDSKSSLDCKLLVPRHVNQAIQNIPQCDFLTNAYMGVDIEQHCSDYQEN